MDMVIFSDYVKVFPQGLFHICQPSNRVMLWESYIICLVSIMQRSGSVVSVVCRCYYQFFAVLL